MATLIEFRHGPYSFFASLFMPEGEPYEAGIVTTDNGYVFEMLYLGGHDGANHLVGGGFQVYTGAGFTAPAGAAYVDGNQDIWISNGTAFVQKTGLPPPPPPPPSGFPRTGTIDGGTWT